MANKIPSVSSSNKSKLNKKETNCKSIFLQPVDVDEINSIILNLRDKRGGVDNIHAKILKSISFFISPVLVKIFNLCILKGTWPEALKQAEVVPVYKSGDKKLITNYRPISLISNFAKIFEKAIHKRLYNFLTKYRRINNKQYGFLRNKSTVMAMEDVLNKIYNSMDRDYSVIATFIDLSKAFDTVNHVKLYEKLFENGIRGVALQLIQSYLRNRKQTVTIKNVSSQPRYISIGVPQGTVLGPLLFLIYIDDIFENCPFITVYADDSVVLSMAQNWQLAEHQMNEYLTILNFWFNSNQLTLNVSKTEYMTLGCYVDSVPTNLKIHINNVEIKRTTTCKYLGIIIDFNLKWDLHIRKILNKIRYFLYVCNKFKYLPLKILETIYFAYVYSLLNYGLIIWGGAYKTVIEPIAKIQQRFQKLLKTEKIPSFECLYITNCILYHYEELSLKFSTSTSRTRNKVISLPNYKKTIAKKNCIYTAIKYFNTLPNELKVLKTSNKTKKEKILSCISQLNSKR